MAGIQTLPRVLPDLGEKVVGLTKEFLGTIFDRDGLREEGQAQQEKATQRIEQVQRELKADAKRAAAQAKDTAEKARQGSSDRHGNGKSEFDKSGPDAAASATTEKVKGGLKQAAGSVTGNQDMRDEGAAQQDKAAEERDVAKEEAKAEQARGRASAAERQQRTAR